MLRFLLGDPPPTPEHLQRGAFEIWLSWWLNGSDRQFFSSLLHFSYFRSATVHPLPLSDHTDSLQLTLKNPISYFTTLICSPREGFSLFLLNIYTCSIFLWQENANLRGTHICFHPISQMQMNSSKEGQTYSRLSEPSLIKRVWCWSKYGSAF